MMETHMEEDKSLLLSLPDIKQSVTHVNTNAESYRSSKLSQQSNYSEVCRSDKCTILEIEYMISERRKVIIPYILCDYIALQYEIASLHPKSKQMFICQFEDGTQARWKSLISCIHSAFRIVPTHLRFYLPIWFSQNWNLIHRTAQKIFAGKLISKLENFLYQWKLETSYIQDWFMTAWRLTGK